MNLNYFEVATCDECGTKEDLQVHKYSGMIRCVHCVNDQLEQVAREEDPARERYYNEDYADECRLEELEKN